ncbi:MAG: ribonuclease J [Coprobacillus sp.]|nr:ribonuclease J [Coprobacillus sp.]
MADSIKVVALGGLDESGRDCYVVEINDDIFVFDCGLSFPDKSTPGIDYFIPNDDYLVENKDRLKAYILTHGHDENIGGILYLYNQAPAPIYCTNATKTILLAEAEFTHVKVPKFNFVIIEPSSTQVIAGHTFQFFQTAHNAPKSFGVALETDRGNIVYTSDFIVDYTVDDPDYYFDLNKLSSIAEKGTLLLMTESKGANGHGYCSPHHKLTSVIEKYFTNNDNRIFIALFYQNLFRITEVFNLCKTHHKKIYPYDAFTRRFLDILFKENSTMPIKKEDLLSKEDLLRARQRDVVVLMLGQGDELYSSIISLAKHENEDKRVVLTKDDTFIVAAIPNPSFESIATRTIDYLYRAGCEVVWPAKKKVISMHAEQDDLKLMLSLLRPKYYLPVRGSYVNLMHNAKLALSMGIGLNHSNVFILDNGTQLVFNEDKVQLLSNINNRIHAWPTMVDGLGYIKEGEELVDDRKKLSVDGVTILAATVSKSKHKIIAGPDCQMRGFVFAKDAEPILKSISNIFVEEINNILVLPNFNFDFEPYYEEIEERIKKWIRRENGREPLVMLDVIVID